MRGCLCAVWLLAAFLLGQAGWAQTIWIGQERPIDEKMFEAIRKNDAKEVQRLLGQGANPKATEANEWPAIVEAASESVDLVKLLLAKGADINARQSGQGWTPLTQALNSSRTDVALYLLAHGADPSLPMNDGTTPLHLAVQGCNVKAVEALLKRKVKVNARTKEEPATVHNAESDRQIANGFEPGYRNAGLTPLFELVGRWREHPEIAKMLLAAGADAKAVDDNGWTLLHYAAKFGSESAVEDALKLGVNPNARSRQGFTPLHVAVRAGFGVPAIHVIRRLLAAGADPKALNKQGQTPEALLRSDAARMLGSMDLSPAASEADPQMRRALKTYNASLQVLHPGAQAIRFPKSPIVEGWTLYPALDMGSGFGGPGGKIERRVRPASGHTELSLVYRPGAEDPPSISITGVELNTYEPLAALPVVLRANSERILAFPKEAAALGGSVRIQFSFGVKNSSGGGELGDPYAVPNPAFVQQRTRAGLEVGVYCDGINRPLEVRIDKLSLGGRELRQFQGKILIVRPPTGPLDPMRPMTYATPIITVKAGQKLNVRYSYRQVGNKKWRSENLDF